MQRVLTDEEAAEMKPELGKRISLDGQQYAVVMRVDRGSKSEWILEEVA